VLQENEVRRLGEGKTRPVNFRLVAASNQPLEKLVEKGDFREDLFFRLNVLRLPVPPLRERLEDIPLLVKFFVPARELSAELLGLLKEYSWPGNVRELRNILWALDALADPGRVLQPSDLPEQSFQRISAALPSEGEDTLETFSLTQEQREREFLERSYRACRGNISKMSRLLGADRSHLHQKLTRLGIHLPRS
jgi:transcriptional regulator of acetoin/glycerol metabolism